MKKLIAIPFFVAAMSLMSCDKGDVEIKRMTRGEGVWAIETMQYDTYDSAGVNVVSTSTLSDVGELIFFESPTLNALFDHHMVVADINDTSGTVYSSPGDVYYDGDRCYFGEDADPNHNFPDFLEGLWTIEENGRKTQVFTMFSVNTNGTLVGKCTMTLKKQ